MSTTRPWYAAGLRFECRPDCGACCTNHGEYAFVYLEDGEPEAIAGLLEMTVGAFLRRYTTTDDGWRVLRMDEVACPFLDGTRCGVYEARPVQCRTFPFWSENVASPKHWSSLASFCPGIDRGERHPLAMIRSRIRERDAE